MAEAGGTTTQSGIHYQNSIAALYLGRLLDSSQRVASQRVVEVRVEAPDHVDDIVTLHAGGGRSFIQAKEALSTTSEAWEKLWSAFAKQAHECNDAQYKLILAIGTISAEIDFLRELCDRAKGIRQIVQRGDEGAIAQLLERFNSRAKDFVRESLFSGLETLAGRNGKRIIRDGDTLRLEQ